MKQIINPTKDIKPIHINGLNGRMLRVRPNTHKNVEILLLYGHHASIERMLGVAEVLARYGGVTMPDYPGFGGMDSFYKIKQKPTLDNYADYMYTFIKWRYKKKKITIAATSFGFLIVTKMLDKYPELTKQVNLLISFVGFLHHEEFILPKNRMRIGKAMGLVFSTKPLAWFAQHIVLRKSLIKYAYKRAANSHAKLKDAESSEELERRLDFEAVLWTINDIRTHMFTQRLMLTINLLDIRIPDVAVHYVGVTHDHFFDMHIIEQHLKIVYKNCTFAKSLSKAHAPTVIATPEDAKAMLPPKTIHVLQTLKHY